MAKKATKKQGARKRAPSRGRAAAAPAHQGPQPAGAPRCGRQAFGGGLEVWCDRPPQHELRPDPGARLHAGDIRANDGTAGRIYWNEAGAIARDPGSLLPAGAP